MLRGSLYRYVSDVVWRSGLSNCTDLSSLKWYHCNWGTSTRQNLSFSTPDWPRLENVRSTHSVHCQVDLHGWWLRTSRSRIILTVRLLLCKGETSAYVGYNNKADHKHDGASRLFILRPLLGFFYYTRHGQRCEWRHIDCRREADMCINFLGSGFTILVVVFESLWYKGLEIG